MRSRIHHLVNVESLHDELLAEAWELMTTAGVGLREARTDFTVYHIPDSRPYWFHEHTINVRFVEC